MNESLSFDDVLLVPQHSSLNSRSEVDLSTSLTFASLSLPIVSAAMDTVTEWEMQTAMLEAGGMGIHHRYQMTDNNLIDAARYGPIAVSPSMGENFLQKLADLREGQVTAVKIDVAHGNSDHALSYADYAVDCGLHVISGNIVTLQAALNYLDIGVKDLCVGIGNGAACSTRIVAGAGRGQWTALNEIYQGLKRSRYDFRLISDGGIKNSGDIVKALAVGADAVIIGSLFSGTYESPGEVVKDGNKQYKIFRGMASESALRDAGKEVNPEGVEGRVPFKGSAVSVLRRLESGMRAGFAYLGARNIHELRVNASWERTTQNTILEGEPRI